MYSDIQAAIPLGFFLSFMIGPVFFVLLETAALKGFKAALVFDLGVILADIIFISAAYFSSLQLLENLNNQPGIYIFGGLVLFIYGATIAFKKEVPLSESPVKVTKSHYVGLFVKVFVEFHQYCVLVFVGCYYYYWPKF
jgi:Putative threonine efflux protein